LYARIPRSPSSTARMPAIRWKAALEAAYPRPQPPRPTGAGGSAVATWDETSTTVPPPAASMAGRSAWVTTTWATTLARRRVSSWSGVRSRNGTIPPGPVVMALLTSTSTRPQRSRTVAAAAWRDARSSRSATTGTARTPRASIAAAVSSRLPGTGPPPPVSESSRPSPGRRVRAVIATSKPAAASATAVALPMPRLAPVTRATRRREAVPTGSCLAQPARPFRRATWSGDLFRRAARSRARPRAGCRGRPSPRGDR
jgi:hypothetical protein